MPITTVGGTSRRACTSLRGHRLLEEPLLNKDTAFSEAEREALGLLGLLPPHVDTLQEQLERAYEEYQCKATDMERHIFLRALQDTNEVLFYALLQAHLEEMMPIVYTPTVGAACQLFSHIYRRPRGLFLSYPHLDRMDAMLANAPVEDVRVIVVTDGGRILGLGDQGAGGMGIPIGKLSLYTLCGGLDPATTLPVLLDVGTDNAERLADPLYLGWRHERVRGEPYDAFVEAFVHGVRRRFPHALVQWEDFGKQDARRILARHRDDICCFNDDIQGTAAVALAGLKASLACEGERLSNQRIVIFGAGGAGVGIADLLTAAMGEEGTALPAARQRIWMLGHNGLLMEGLPGMDDAQGAYAQPRERLAGWEAGDRIDLETVVRRLAPTALIGVSAQAGAFTEPILRAMAGGCRRPIVFPLSNPSSRAEAVPADVLAWTEGRARVATGSPFPPVQVGGRTVPIDQCNNCYVFPGIGLGVVIGGARRISDGMFMAAANTLCAMSPSLDDPQAPLFPPLTRVREVSRRIAFATALEAQCAGFAPYRSEESLHAWIQETVWEPRYPVVAARPRP